MRLRLPCRRCLPKLQAKRPCLPKLQAKRQRARQGQRADTRSQKPTDSQHVISACLFGKGPRPDSSNLVGGWALCRWTGCGPSRLDRLVCARCASCLDRLVCTVWKARHRSQIAKQQQEKESSSQGELGQEKSDNLPFENPTVGLQEVFSCNLSIPKRASGTQEELQGNRRTP